MLAAPGKRANRAASEHPAPAPDEGVPGGGAERWGHGLSTSSGQILDKLNAFRVPPAARFERHHNELASVAFSELRIGVFLVPSRAFGD